MKICSKCGKEYPATTEYFYKNSKCKDGLSTWCITCHKEYRQIYVKQHQKEIQEYKEKQKQNPEYKEKHNKQSLDYYEKHKENINVKQKQYYKQNRDKIIKQVQDNYASKTFEEKQKLKEYQRNYRETNKDYIKQQRKNFRKQNKDKLAKQDKQRYENNKFNRTFSVAVYTALKGAKAGRHWEELVPYTLEQLRQHIESQFTPPMSWDNYGTYWELDHIVPQNLFNFSSPEDKEFQICWSLANLRPLEKSLNRQRPKDGSDVPNELKVKIYNML